MSNEEIIQIDVDSFFIKTNLPYIEKNAKKVFSTLKDILDAYFYSNENKIIFLDKIYKKTGEELQQYKGRQGIDNWQGVEMFLFYINEKISKLKNENVIYLPKIFNIPTKSIDSAKIAVIFPFDLTETYKCIKDVCSSFNISCVKANDIPNNNAFMQNVFEMIYTSKIAVCDFTKGNNNVLYETGITHTLGREVIPITQSMEDVPSDLKHINMIVYSNTEEGYQHLKNELKNRLENIFPTNLPFNL